MKLNRRQLLGSAAAVAATAAAPVAMAAVKEEKADLVIIGGGLAGLCAAYAAVRKGVKPIVLEKLQFLGGAGLFPEGSLGVNTRYTKEHGIKTTVQQVLDAALQYHHFRADPAILRVLIEESGRTIDDVLDLGIELRGIRTVYPKEESLQTWHLFKGGCAAVIQKFVEQIKAKGGTIHTETTAEKLIMENGRVAGVEATTAKGDKYIIKAKKVIIATGGFAANKEMLAQYVFDSSDLGMIEPIWLRGPVVDGRTGDGINMARLVGAGVTGMHTVAGNAPYLPDVPPINQFSGPVTTAGGVSYTIFDQHMMDKMVNEGAVLPFNAIVLAGVPLKALPKTWEIGMQRGWAFKADTVEELAQQLGMPPENLVDTMKRVNKYAEEKHDPEFGRLPEHLVKFDMEKGPYYALKAIRCFFLTLGGVKVTPNFEARTPQGDVIPGLYVVGQDIGGLFDSTYDLRCEGSASSFAMTSGRVAAEHAIKMLEAGK